MSTLADTDHMRLRVAERTWLVHSADRLRRAAGERRTSHLRPGDLRPGDPRPTDPRPTDPDSEEQAP